MSSAALSPHDLWKTRVPEHEESTDYRDLVLAFIRDGDNADDLDQLLELAVNLNIRAERFGLDRNEMPVASIVDFIDNAFPGFKKTDRLCDVMKRKAGVA